MKHRINRIKKFLCFFFIHDFQTLNSTPTQATVVCNRCRTTWYVDHTEHTMQPVAKDTL